MYKFLKTGGGHVHPVPRFLRSWLQISDEQDLFRSYAKVLSDLLAMT